MSAGRVPGRSLPRSRPARPLAMALLIVRLEIAAVPDCTKKARPALLASSVLPLPVTVTLVVIIGSDCVSVMLAVTLMLLSPPLLAAKMALRRAVSFATSTAQGRPAPEWRQAGSQQQAGRQRAAPCQEACSRRRRRNHAVAN